MDLQTDHFCIQYTGKIRSTKWSRFSEELELEFHHDMHIYWSSYTFCPKYRQCSNKLHAAVKKSKQTNKRNKTNLTKKTKPNKQNIIILLVTCCVGYDISIIGIFRDHIKQRNKFTNQNLKTTHRAQNSLLWIELLIAHTTSLWLAANTKYAYSRVMKAQTDFAKYDFVFFFISQKIRSHKKIKKDIYLSTRFWYNFR